MTITTLKLITGEEIIGDVTQESDSEIVVMRPVTMVESEEPGSISLVPWIYSIDIAKPITIDKDKVFLTAVTDIRFADSYSKYDSSLTTALEELEAEEQYAQEELDEDDTVTIH
jgi:hypothetical protein